MRYISRKKEIKKRKEEGVNLNLKIIIWIKLKCKKKTKVKSGRKMDETNKPRSAHARKITGAEGQTHYRIWNTTQWREIQSGPSWCWWKKKKTLSNSNNRVFNSRRISSLSSSRLFSIVIDGLTQSEKKNKRAEQYKRENIIEEQKEGWRNTRALKVVGLEQYNFRYFSISANMASFCFASGEEDGLSLELQDEERSGIDILGIELEKDIEEREGIEEEWEEKEEGEEEEEERGEVTLDIPTNNKLKGNGTNNDLHEVGDLFVHEIFGLVLHWYDFLGWLGSSHPLCPDGATEWKISCRYERIVCELCIWTKSSLQHWFNPIKK